MSPKENTPGFRTITDLSRAISLVLLFLNFYYFCYGGFVRWGLVSVLTDRILQGTEKTGLFNSPEYSILLALGFLAISLIGSRGRKEEKLSYKTGLYLILAGLPLYFVGYLLLRMAAALVVVTCLYMGFTAAGYLLILTGGAKLSKVLRYRLNAKDVFNKDNAGFPQERQLIRTEFSVNLPAEYVFRGKKEKSWINIINGRRGVLVMGSPGCGKSYFIIENIIRQYAEKGLALFVFDFKYDTLSRLVYHQFLTYRHKYPASARFYSVNFSDLSRSHRCNLLDPSTMRYIADAIGASRTLFLSMNRTWVHKQGDFFVESPVNFLAAVIWWLRKYKGGIFCTLPHAIELAQTPYDKLFCILVNDPDIKTLINPFYEAFQNRTMEMLDSQISSARIPLGRLASPELYYILTGNDLSLDINNPAAPAILCLGGDPQRQEALAPVLSLFIDRLNKQINQKGRYPCAMIIDEFATIRAPAVLTTIATARSNDVVPVIAVQDLSQLRTQYSRDEADLILNVTGNLVCGQVGGETARWVSERFPSTMQDRTSISINTNDVSVSRSRQLDKAVTPSTVAMLSSGEFLGIVTDDPDNKMELKAFHGTVINDHEKLAKEREGYVSLPVVRVVNEAMVKENYHRVRAEVEEMVAAEGDRIVKESRGANESPETSLL